MSWPQIQRGWTGSCVSWVFSLICQLCDNINSQLGKAVRRLAYVGDLFYILWNISSYLFINI